MIQQNVRLKPEPKCPECYTQMVLRTRRADQVKFWGCPDWPDCSGTRSIKPDGTPIDDDDLFDGDDFGWWADPNDVKNTL